MRAFSALGSAISALRAPYMNRGALHALQERKLRRVIRHAAQHVPYYRRLFDTAGIDPCTIRSLADLSRVPVTSKAELLAAGASAFSSAYRPEDVVAQRTTGSTGEPMTMRFDRHFEFVRSLIFLRALLATGYRPGQRMLMMKPAHSSGSPAWTRWRSVRFDEPPARVLDRILLDQPTLLYGWVTPLRELAMHVRRSGARIDAVRIIVTTAEALDDGSRKDLADAFNADVYDFYGLTEMGTVAWECSQHEGLHLSEDLVLVEPAVADDVDADPSLIMTNLDLTAMPLIRYRTGDLARSLDSRPCACGRGFHRLGSLSGRMVDCLRLTGGRVLSPYRVTLALEAVPDLRRYQVVQDEVGSLSVRFEAASPASAAKVSAAIGHALGPLVGSDVRIETRHEDSVSPPPGRKFRIVESRVLER